MKSPSERHEPYPIPEIPVDLEAGQLLAAGVILGIIIASIFWAIALYVVR